MIKKVIRKTKEYGLSLTIIRGLKKLNYKMISGLNYCEKRNIWKNASEYKELKKICKDKKYKSVFVFYPFLIWNLPAFQRPQQIASALAKHKDVLYIYCTPDSSLDGFYGLYKKISDNLILTVDYEFVMRMKLKNKIIQFYSTDVLFDYKCITQAKKFKNKILYEYIDGIDEKLLGNIPKSYLEKHEKILKDESIYVIASADKLIKDVERSRNKNYSMVCNGVVIDDFNVKKANIPANLKPIRQKYEKLICYYGALANWFDYDLLKKCAKKYPNYGFILIGIDYDKTLEKAKLDKYENIIYLGKVEYKKLINYTKNCDLLTIPFLINHITESTSPVKLFEYMATQKPILTTAMPECKKYESVIIGENHDDYVKKIESTLKLINDTEYLKLEMEEAKMNTWASKANDILDLVNGDDKSEKSN